MTLAREERAELVEDVQFGNRRAESRKTFRRRWRPWCWLEPLAAMRFCQAPLRHP